MTQEQLNKYFSDEPTQEDIDFTETCEDEKYLMSKFDKLNI
jgi:hypothetical protein